jgi:hypothetical protein
MIARNFDSFRWVLKLKNKVIIYEAYVDMVVHRYGDFGATEDINIDSSKRYMVMTYFGQINDQYQYINAIYDLRDLHKGPNDEPYLNCYIM